MKIRNGFVTNSSSSSFIVATTSSGGEAFLDMIRFLMDHNSGYDYDVKTVFPEEETTLIFNQVYSPNGGTLLYFYYILRLLFISYSFVNPFPSQSSQQPASSFSVKNAL